VLERLGRKQPPLLEGEAAGGHRVEHLGVAVRTGHDRHRGVVLGGGPDHRGAADVDLLDALVRRRTGEHGLAERVEVGDHQVEGFDAELVELPHVRVESAVGQDAGLHLGVEGLDPSVEALREPGQLLDLGDRQGPW